MGVTGGAAQKRKRQVSESRSLALVQKPLQTPRRQGPHDTRPGRSALLAEGPEQRPQVPLGPPGFPTGHTVYGDPGNWAPKGSPSWQR